MQKFWRAAHLRTFLLTAAASAALAAPAFAREDRQSFSIPPQSTASALNEFARQAGVQILFSFDAANATSSPVIVPRP